MTTIIKNPAKTLLVITFAFLVFQSQAQDWKTEKRINIVTGLSQALLVKGFNIEGNYIHNRFIFDYSHGLSLDFSENTVTTDLKRQGVAVHMPYTTGFGIGYRIKEWINVRFEPKWHRFEFYYNGEDQKNAASKITSYNTMSLGVGLYGHYQPFKKKSSFLKGFLITPSLRFWPTVSSSLSGDKFTHFNKNTQAMEEIKQLDPGLNFTPLVFNVSVGYSFQLKKRI
jgi:hypothetical protein